MESVWKCRVKAVAEGVHTLISTGSRKVLADTCEYRQVNCSIVRFWIDESPSDLEPGSLVLVVADKDWNFDESTLIGQSCVVFKDNPVLFMSATK